MTGGSDWDIHRLYKHVRDDFESKLQEQLERTNYGCFVFWTPEREKAASSAKTMDRIRNSEWYNRTPFHKRVNGEILRLNEKLHSHELLRKIVGSTVSAKSRVFPITFSVTPGDTYILLSALYPDTDGTGENDNADFRDLEVKISFPAYKSPDQLLERIEGENLREQRLYDTLSNYVDSWKEDAPDISDSVNKSRRRHEALGRRHALDSKESGELQKLWLEAVKHIALMFLFSKLNSFKSVTYYLSPLDRGKLKSSMVIYWKDREPERSCHYLIQMLLGLNAAPVLLHHERLRIKESAFRNTGHTMYNRLGVLKEYFHSHEEKWHSEFRKKICNNGIPIRKLARREREYHKAWISTESLSQTFLALQLWGFSNIEEFWYGWKREPEKKTRFFAYDGSHFDLIAEFPVWGSIVFESRPLVFGGTKNGRNIGNDYEVYLHLTNQGVKEAILYPRLYDEERKKECRLNENVLQAIFWEIFYNAVR
jgi:hypothetical protein